ncbi:unnamed protein product [Adineta ricciae]|uniref:NHL repeat containing protein-like protein n=1 Tax=Adineta ricciae TaxID=249248 RepID=A0A814PN72_ADIRI|nr:unnamed protein product [Adineta ricciae]
MKIAIISIVSSSFLSIFPPLPDIIYYRINQQYSICFADSFLYYYYYYTVCFIGLFLQTFVPFSILSSFGWLTYRNLKRINVQHHQVTVFTRQQHINAYLIRILIFQILCYLLSAFSVFPYNLHATITLSWQKTPLQRATENVVSSFVYTVGFTHTCTQSFNRPKFRSSIAWNQHAITFSDNTTIGSQPYGIFIDKNNTIYIADRANSRVLIWVDGNIMPMKSISSNVASPYALFLTTEGAIYVDSDNSTGRVDKWSMNATSGVHVLYICSKCYNLFVDTNNNLYCSMSEQHQVIKKSLKSISNAYIIVAGTGVPGNDLNRLNRPWGIFININFDLYVADSYNHRIQLFQAGQFNGIAVAGKGSSTLTISLSFPTGILLDADNYLFIVDQGNHRIVGSDRNGFRCIVGCTGARGLASNQLMNPVSMSFDSLGNIYVVDRDNTRVQKFTVLKNIVVSYNQPKVSTNAVWSPNAVTFADRNAIGTVSFGIFITTNNTVYVADQTNDRIQVWFNDSVNPTQTIYSNLTDPYGVFATSDGDIFIDNGAGDNHVVKWLATENTTVPVMNVSESCRGLFVDINNTLYCSMPNYHLAIKRWLDDNSSTETTAAGTGVAGNTPTTLNYPMGIFVDVNFDLYIADMFNDRVQLFRLGQSTGITVAGSTSLAVTVTLNRPIGVTLRNDGYLFILDCDNNRVVGSGPGGFHCIVGCTGGSGSASYQLANPRTFGFDSNGNIYINDYGNTRIQKFVLLDNTDVAYNQPKFCANASWDPNGIIFAANTTIGANPYGIFVTKSNTIYVTNGSSNRVQVWFNGSANPSQTIFGSFLNPYTIFIRTNGDMFVDNGSPNGRVDKLLLTTNKSYPVMYVNESCFGLFVDIGNMLYCSMRDYHRVVKRWLGDNFTVGASVVGTGIAGNASDSLSWPHGLFVTSNFDLYVADRRNHRIQLFRFGQLNGTTVVGKTSVNITITLNQPIAITLDADDYLFIVDCHNHRVVGSGPNGFRCIVGCSGSSGAALNQLSYPQSFSFDSFGNIYITDWGNNRVQKFILLTNSCGKLSETVDHYESTEDDDTTSILAANIGYTSSPLSTAQSNVTTMHRSQIIVSYNQPKLGTYATWSANAITFANNNTIGSHPYSLFITTNNTIYVPNRSLPRVQIWLNNSSAPTQTISLGIDDPRTIFVTVNGDLFIANSGYNYSVNRWSPTTNTVISILSFNSTCASLFVDVYDNLYCSAPGQHQVLAKSLSDLNITIVVAGTGCSGSSSNMLYGPLGIFVDVNLDLYVADRYNHRIQLFESDKLNALTVAGSSSTNITISLNVPTAIALDADNYLFIVDSGNNRIVGSGSNGFRCIVGCSGSSDSAPDQLSSPQFLAFDSYGNIYVTDFNNSRVQKFILLNHSHVPSYNQPKFCANASWDPIGTTFANNTLIGSRPYGLFVTRNNTVYVTDRSNNQIHIWFNNSVTPTQSIARNVTKSSGIFVTLNGDIFIDNGQPNGVDKLSLTTNTSIIVLRVNDTCADLFVDDSDTLYCSMRDYHRVVKRWLGDNFTVGASVVGTGIAGNASDSLSWPHGLFVTSNFDLYVADRRNHRIQLFHFGQLNGTTVVGKTSVNITITLNQPVGITLDADDYLFIVDCYNHRVVGSGPNGFRCIVGCTGVRGSGSDQLAFPVLFSFDSFGNIYVTDWSNNRTQKFYFLQSSCGK